MPIVVFWIVLVALVVLIIAALPAWPYSRGFGYFPVGVLAAALIFFLLLVWFGVVALVAVPEA